VKSATTLILAGVLLGAGFVPTAEAADRRKPKQHQAVARHYDHASVRYITPRDVVVIREHYHHHRPLPPGIRHVYAKHGHLPPGWAKRVAPVPVYVERRLPVLPHGYHRGIIDGHAVVYNQRGLIIDVAVLF
jgi:hypothetical protein